MFRVVHVYPFIALVLLMGCATAAPKGSAPDPSRGSSTSVGTGIFQNFEDGNGTKTGAYYEDEWQVESVRVTSDVHEGGKALAVSPTMARKTSGQGAVRVKAVGGKANLTGKKHLSFWVKASMEGNPIEVNLYDASGRKAKIWSDRSSQELVDGNVTLEEEWAQIAVAITDFDPKAIDLAKITMVGLYWSDWDTPYLLDDFRVE